MAQLVLQQLSFLFLISSSWAIFGDEVLQNSTGYSSSASVRLPKAIVPTDYQVYLGPLISPEFNFTLYGHVSIEFQCVEATKQIVLHVNGLHIVDPVKVTDEYGTSCILARHYDKGHHDLYVFEMAQMMVVNRKYNIVINFRGTLNDKMIGMYHASYIDPISKQTKYLAVTHFEPTHARKVFPCFDEPSFKAQFEISLARSSEHVSLSNMPLLRTSDLERGVTIPGDDWKLDVFERTVPMSTYLLAFIISDFTMMQTVTMDQKPFRVWSRTSVLDQSKYALEVGPKILQFYEQYFKVEYPLPKMDLASIPDFKSGAMENWGLITFRESNMLWSPMSSTVMHKKRIVQVIAHEMAHQWFGNLVSPLWWDYLWLNEGFANFVEYLGVNAVEPTMEYLNSFTVEQVHVSMDYDALDSSHPVSAEVTDPKEISQIFDAISYKKGASLIRMMNHFLTEDTLRRGLTAYLTKFRYNCATPDDLWTTLTSQAQLDNTIEFNITVKEVMDSWTLKMGYPVVHVVRKYINSTVGMDSISITQSKFKISKVEKPDSKWLWWIPISYASSSYNSNFSDTQPELWISPKSGTYKLETIVKVKHNEWIIVNVQQTGFYRVNYDIPNWQAIGKQLKANFSVIHPVNRAQVLNDGLSLAHAGYIPYNVAFALSMYLRNESNYIPWDAYLSANSDILKIIRTWPVIYPNYRNYMWSLLEPHYEQFVDKKSRQFAILSDMSTMPFYLFRNHIVKSTCILDEIDCVSRSIELYTMWMLNPSNNTISIDLRPIVYCTAIRHGEAKEWDFLWTQYLESNVPSEQQMMLGALSCPNDDWLISRFLERAIDPNGGIRKQDMPVILDAVARNIRGVPTLMEFLEKRWLEISEYVGRTILKQYGKSFVFAAEHLSTTNQLERLKKFKEKYANDLGTAELSIQNAIERVEDNIIWAKNNKNVIMEWLNSQHFSQMKFIPAKNETVSTD